MKNSYRIRIKVRWCRDSILQKKFWKFIPHPRTTAHNYTHSRTSAHTCAHPHTLTYTQKHPTHTRSWLELDKSYQITVNRKTAEETKKERKKEKGRNKSPLKHFSGLKNLLIKIILVFFILGEIKISWDETFFLSWRLSFSVSYSSILSRNCIPRSRSHIYLIVQRYSFNHG